MSATNREVVEQLWRDLYARDFDAVGSAFADDGEYTDMPTPAEDVAREMREVRAVRGPARPVDEDRHVSASRSPIRADSAMMCSTHHCGALFINVARSQ